MMIRETRLWNDGVGVGGRVCADRAGTIGPGCKDENRLLNRDMGKVRQGQGNDDM